MTLSRLWLAAALMTLLAACSGGGGGGMLPAGVVARMDAPGARLDRAAALDLVNAYRASQGAPALVADPVLEAEAQRLASAYAASGKAPRRPDGASTMLLSAGYADFANAFSGWRAGGADARSLAMAAGRAGLAVSYRENSTYGIHWVLLLGP
jgi:hypothetical protein